MYDDDDDDDDDDGDCGGGVGGECELARIGEVHHDISVAAALVKIKELIGVPAWRPYSIIKRKRPLDDDDDVKVMTGKHLLRTCMGYTPRSAVGRRVRARRG